MSNTLSLSLEKEAVPMVYPYLASYKGLREKLIENKFFVARYWPNVLEWCQPNDWEYQLAENLVCLPIDQRYDDRDMQSILDLVLHNS